MDHCLWLAPNLPVAQNVMNENGFIFSSKNIIITLNDTLACWLDRRVAAVDVEIRDTIIRAGLAHCMFVDRNDPVRCFRLTRGIVVFPVQSYAKQLR